MPHKDILYIDQLNEKLLDALRNGLDIKVSTRTLLFGQAMPEKMKSKIPIPLQKSKKIHQNMSTFTNMHLFPQACMDFKKSSKNLGGIFHQMDPIW